MGGYYWYSDNPNCGRCGHLNGQGFCNMTACIYPLLPQTAVMTEHRLTNGDRIRAMTDEEMAAFMFTANGCPMWVSDYSCKEDKGCHGAKCACWLDWLKQEATE